MIDFIVKKINNFLWYFGSDNNISSMYIGRESVNYYKKGDFVRVIDSPRSLLVQAVDYEDGTIYLVALNGFGHLLLSLNIIPIYDD